MKKKKNIWNIIKLIIVLTITCSFFLFEKDIKNAFILFITTIYLICLTNRRKKLFFLTIFPSTTLLFINFNLIKNYSIKNMFFVLKLLLITITSNIQIINNILNYKYINLSYSTINNFNNKYYFLKNTNLYSAFIFISKKLSFFYFFYLIFIIIFLIIYIKKIGEKSLKKNNNFSGFFASSCSIWFLTQTIVNMFNIAQHNTTSIPILPFLIYGKANFISIWIAILIIIKIDFLKKKKLYQAFYKI
ncbi:FtsW/RodA/SpoVE family cell cycle protein [Buchnera aphidicola]|uniref:FtsW/RodA/SpoVE family cell cycle protein n=1 Tax=Buchnera aphidicola TaxID=9 RepID=UPI0034642C0D